MTLTDIEIRSAKPAASVVKLSDGGGLQLWVERDGGKRWRLAYRFAGKQKALALGVYPELGLKGARALRDEARRLLADGRDPGAVRKQTRLVAANAAANTFEAIAAELVAKKRAEAKADATIAKTEWLLGLANEGFGSRPISEISAADVLAVLRRVEGRGRLESARRLRAAIGQVFRYAIATGRAENDPSGALRGAIASPVVRHRAAIIEPQAFGALLRAIAGYEGAPETKAALQLLGLTFVRPGELRAAEWSEFDLANAVWSIPPEKMKMKRPHRVPLAAQAMTLLEGLRALTGGGKYLFPSVRSAQRCMSENTLNAALRRLGYASEQMSAHGFRSAASSILNENGQWNPDAIERQLAHVDNDSVRRAYARADFWDERVRMMAWWANRCDEMRALVR
ncbi:MAG: tyrosine-type recombinase/integrase [Hyphomicrobiales bacterium]|nr:tyrosine-type recombinase/integrase [Hyphomicrobiales bacterium]